MITRLIEIGAVRPALILQHKGAGPNQGLWGLELRGIFYIRPYMRRNNGQGPCDIMEKRGIRGMQGYLHGMIVQGQDLFDHPGVHPFVGVVFDIVKGEDHVLR